VFLILPVGFLIFFINIQYILDLCPIILINCVYQYEVKIKMRKENNVIFGVIIDKDLKNEFLRIATENEETASKLIRKFIKNYVRGN